MDQDAAREADEAAAETEARAAHAAAEAAKQLEGVSFSGDPIHGVNGPLHNNENADPNKPRKQFVDVEDLD